MQERRTVAEHRMQTREGGGEWCPSTWSAMVGSHRADRAGSADYDIAMVWTDEGRTQINKNVIRYRMCHDASHVQIKMNE